MLIASRPLRAPLAGRLFALAALAGAAISASACSNDSPAPSADGGTGGGEETGGKAGAGGMSSTGGKGGSGGSAGGGAGDTGATCTGGPSTGTNDPAHCKEADGGAITQAIGVCVPEGADAGQAPAEPDGGAVSDYGETLYGTEADDDDCKYHAKYTVAPICESEGVTFVITLTKTTDGKPVTGAAPYVEATLNGLPAKKPLAQTITEKAGGIYEVGPVLFDKPGKWTTRFHFFETCSDSEDSPHGHVAFYMDIP
jgi:hypothetical protein